MKKATSAPLRILVLCTCAILLVGALGLPATPAHAFSFVSSEPDEKEAIPDKSNEDEDIKAVEPQDPDEDEAEDKTEPIKSTITNATEPTGATTAEKKPTSDVKYGKTNIKGVNVRERASAKSDSVVRLRVTGTVFKVNGETTTDSGETWYVVEIGKHKGYIRSDLVTPIDEMEYNAGKNK